MLSTSQILYLSPFLFSMIIMIWTGTFAWNRQKVAGATEFSLFVGMQVLWSTGFIVELLASSLEWKLFWDDIQWPFTILAATTYGLFILRYTHGFKLNTRQLGLLLAVVIPLVIYSLTDQWHHTIRSNVRLEVAQPFDALIYDYSFGFYLVSIISFLVTVAGIIVLVVNIFQSQKEFYKQSLTILLGIMIPLVGSLLTLMDVVLYTYRDTSPISFALGSAVVLWGLFRYGLFDLVPVAMRTVLDTIEAAVLVFDSTRRVVFMNAAAGNNLQVELQDVLGKSAKDIFPAHAADVDYFRNLDFAEKEIETVNREGITQHYVVKQLPLLSNAGQKIGQVAVFNNITNFKTLTNELQEHKEKAEQLVVQRTAELEQRNQELLEEVALRTEAEDKVKTNLEEKTELVQEINHRVRNNMSLIMSLLNMQTQYLDPTVDPKPFNNINNRIYSMSLVHTMMYHTGDFRHVSVKQYLQRLYTHIIHQKRSNLTIDLITEVKDVDLPIEKAIPVGLIFNEILSNAITHGFPEVEKGQILIQGDHQSNGIVRFSVFDSGVGFDHDEIGNTETFGLKMVDLLIEQLEGEIAFDFDEGTRVSFSFRMMDTSKWGINTGDQSS